MSIFQPNLLAGKTAFITGGGSGICQRIAERYAQHGAKVMLLGRKQEKLEAAAAGIQAAGGTAATFPADVRDYPALEAAAARTRELFAEIDLVVCGAAGNFPAPVNGMSANGFRAVIDIDLNGTFNTCRAVYAHLRKPGASIIAISATHAFLPLAYQSHVCAAKAGIELFIKSLAIEWGPEGIRANCISPGPIDDTEGMRRLAPTEAVRERFSAAIPLRRFGTRDEIADLALFMSSPAAAYLTGSVYVCDGGQSLNPAGMAFADAVAPQKSSRT